MGKGAGFCPPTSPALAPRTLQDWQPTGGVAFGQAHSLIFQEKHRGYYIPHLSVCLAGCPSLHFLQTRRTGGGGLQGFTQGRQVNWHSWLSVLGSFDLFSQLEFAAPLNK